MLQHYRMFAAYNSWANTRVYSAASSIAYEDFTRDLGAFFRSIQGTLNHILYVDKVWMARFSGQNTGPAKLDTILHEDLKDLRLAREAEDRKIISFVDALTPEQLKGRFSYQRGNPPEFYTDSLEKALAHFFNHQTHHRGQLHMMFTMMGQPSLELDLIYFLRSESGTPFA